MTVSNVAVGVRVRRVPEARAVLELLKPVTWFPPMWAFSCGVMASGRPWAEVWPTWLAGLCLTGPLVCAAPQAAIDWFDGGIDAVNEPRRPIPCSRRGVFIRDRETCQYCGAQPGRKGLTIDRKCLLASYK